MADLLKSAILALFLVACGGAAPDPVPTCDGHTFLDLAINQPACVAGSSCAFSDWGEQLSESSPGVVYRFTCVGGKYSGEQVAPHHVTPPPSCGGLSLDELEAVPAPACEPFDACSFDAKGDQVALEGEGAAFTFGCVDGRYALVAPAQN